MTVYGIVRTDNVKATYDGNIRSGKYFVGATATQIENGNLVQADELVSTVNREVFKCITPVNLTDKNIFLVASPELIYDETKHYSLADFVNPAGGLITLIGLSTGDIVSVSDECIVPIDDADDIPAVGSYITNTAGGTKWTEKTTLGGTETVVGKIIARELYKKDTYLSVIEIL